MKLEQMAGNGFLQSSVLLLGRGCLQNIQLEAWALCYALCNIPCVALCNIGV